MSLGKTSKQFRLERVTEEYNKCVREREKLKVKERTKEMLTRDEAVRLINLVDVILPELLQQIHNIRNEP